MRGIGGSLPTPITRSALASGVVVVARTPDPRTAHTGVTTALFG